MAEELQHLIDRIQREAVETGEQKAAEQVAQAKEQAAALLREAEQKAHAIVQRAEQDARQYAERSQQTLQQAARDVLISVGQGVEAMLTRFAVESVGQAMTPELLKELLVKLVGSLAGPEGSKTQVLVSPQDQAKLMALLQEKLRDQMQKGLVVTGDERIIKGFQVSLEGGRIKHQFTPESIAESLSAFLRPALADIVYKAAREGGGARA